MSWSRFVALLIVLAALAWPAGAHAQSCCAGAGALTPGRLSQHEDALVGMQSRAATGFGRFTDDGTFAASSREASEIDVEQDFFASLRVLRRGQVSLLVPFAETRRRFPTTGAEIGGGIGDVNASARYDFLLARRDRWVPGVALLAGTTLPTGTPPDSAHKPLATDATGIGAFQGNVGVAVEQTFGGWLVNATALLAQRTARTVRSNANAPEIHERLGTQLVVIAGAAYSFRDDSAFAAFASYTVEGDATIDGAETPATARRSLQLTAAGVLPLTDRWRLQGSLSMHPPISDLGRNQTATAGLTWTLVRAWM